MTSDTDIVRRALDLPLDPEKKWPKLLLTRYTGTIPPAVCEAPTMLELIPGSFDSQNDKLCSVSGFFEYSSNLVTANCGGFSGELKVAGRTFKFMDRSPKDAWTFVGSVSDNGLVIFLSIRWEDGFECEQFCLIQTDAFESLIPEDKK